MASVSSAVPRNPVLRRTVTSATVTDSESSAAVSPSDSPRPSPSSTSLSSLSSVDVAEKPTYSGLIDTYGNEFTPPDFTIKDIRDAIPKHCFERSAVTGYLYILRDLICLATTFLVFNNFVTPEYIPSTPVRALLWAGYTVLQGLFGTGIWVIAHECGHGAFSDSTLVNNITGWVLHSSLLVPYFSWQISHRKHHKATGNMERDMVFVPRTREQHATRVGRMAHELAELTEETPAYTLLMLIGQQLVGWPQYLLTNVTGHNFHERQREGRGKGKKNGYGGGVNHFDPRSPLYEAKDAKLIVLSDIGIAITATALVYLGNTFGWSNMAVWYFIPYLWVNHWLGTSSLVPQISWVLMLTLFRSQWPSLSFSTRTPLCPITRVTSGTLFGAPPRQSTARWDSSVATCCTASSRRTSCTTMSAAFPSTRPTRRPTPSAPSWASTTVPTRKMAPGGSSVPCGRAHACASGLSPAKGPRAPAKAFSSSATAMVWGLSRRLQRPSNTTRGGIEV